MSDDISQTPEAPKTIDEQMEQLNMAQFATMILIGVCYLRLAHKIKKAQPITVNNFHGPLGE
jgi:hypothetical protein